MACTTTTITVSNIETELDRKLLLDSVLQRESISRPPIISSDSDSESGTDCSSDLESFSNEAILESFDYQLLQTPGRGNAFSHPRPTKLLCFGRHPVSRIWDFVLVPDEAYYTLRKFLVDIDTMTRSRALEESSSSSHSSATDVLDRCEAVFRTMRWLPPRLVDEIATDRYKL